jgi:hypothetical protein
MSYLRTNRVKLNEASTLRETCSGQVRICYTDIFEDSSRYNLYRREHKSLLHIFVDFFLDRQKSDTFITEFFLDFWTPNYNTVLNIGANIWAYKKLGSITK